jgi:hypothetical protein
VTATETEQNPLLKLLAPFPEEMVGKLPRIICRACSKNYGQCEEHKKEKCGECGAITTPRHIHLDYVGHADVTRRLLEVDPAWQWEPVAEDDNGLPLLDTDDRGNPVGLWIKLTVLGVTRLGYGSCPSSQGDAVKVLIGDALRNAAMRFGVALDLWAKGDRADPTAENAVAASGRRAQHQRQQSAPPASVDTGWVQDFEKRLAAATADSLGKLRQEVLDKFKARALDPDTGNRLMDAIKQRQAELGGQEAA